MKEEVEPVSKRALNFSFVEARLGTIKVGSNCFVIKFGCANCGSPPRDRPERLVERLVL